MTNRTKLEKTQMYYVAVHNNLHIDKAMYYTLRFEQNLIKFNNTNITQEIQPKLSTHKLKLTGKKSIFVNRILTYGILLFLYSKCFSKISGKNPRSCDAIVD